MIEIFTDGACRGNPGPGGWGAILRSNRHEKTVSGAEKHPIENQSKMMTYGSS
jgi:ribonuclease HI